MAYWFTSDTHFGHANIIDYCCRPFETVQEMDHAIVQNWNKAVAKGDTVFHLGDFGFKSWRRIGAIREQLKGEIVILRGNHDTSVSGFVKAGFKANNIHQYMEATFNGVLCFLSHVPMVSKYHDLVLHGHVHLAYAKNGPLFNVGVDVNNMRPVPLKTIINYFKEYKPTINDVMMFPEEMI